MVDLVLIHPGAAHGIYGSDLADSLVAVEPPLWCRLIAGYVRDRDCSVKIIDAEAQGFSPADVAEIVERWAPRLICIAAYGHQPSASTQQMDGAGKTAREIKGRGIRAPIIMVGGHVAALPVQTLAEEEIDYACNGEGPITIHGLLNRVDIQAIPGLVWRSAAGLIRVNDAPPLIEVAELHGDAWDLLPMDRYRAHNWQCFGMESRQPYASIYTSLGCPYKCSFCCINAPFQSNRYRMRAPQAVVDEITKLWNVYGVRTFKIVDEMFVLNRQHYEAICTLLSTSTMAKDLNIWAYARIDTVREDNLELLRAAGIRWLALGIESGSSHVRDGSQKALKNNDILGIVHRIQNAGISVIGNYIFGLPDEDRASMWSTMELAFTLQTEFANFYTAMAYPGSKLYSEALQKGWTLPATWRGYSQHNEDCRPLDTEHLTAAEVLAFRDRAFNAYFSNPNYLAMIEGRFGPETRAHVKEMTKYKLRRKLLTPSTVTAAAE